MRHDWIRFRLVQPLVFGFLAAVLMTWDYENNRMVELIQKHKAHCGKTAGNQLRISKAPATEDAEIYSSANPPPPAHDRRKPDAVLQGKRLKVQQLEDWH